MARAAADPLSHVMSIFGGQTVSLTAADVAEIMRLLEQSSFDELTLEIEGSSSACRRGAAAAERADESAERRLLPRQRRPTLARGIRARPPQSAAAADPNVQDVAAPLLGTFYRAPKPGAPPFVEVGAAVEEDTVVAHHRSDEADEHGACRCSRHGSRNPGRATERSSSTARPLLRVRKSG